MMSLTFIKCARLNVTTCSGCFRYSFRFSSTLGNTDKAANVVSEKSTSRRKLDTRSSLIGKSVRAEASLGDTPASDVLYYNKQYVPKPDEVSEPAPCVLG